MLTVNKLIQELEKLKLKGYGDLPLIYSVDDEGNAYHTVHEIPSEFQVEDITQYYLECSIEYDEDNKVIPFIPNCIILN